MRNQVFKKLFSVLLALIMVAGLLPASAMAGGWGAMDVDTTPELTETEQPTESAEPTKPAETETPEVTEVPEPTPENPATTVEPTQGEPTAEPTDEGIMPANVMPVQANVELQYRIVHLDCGRKYFSKDWIIALMYEAKAAGYNQVQLAFGNKGLRFLLDDMSVNTYEKQAVTDAIKEGNKAYYNAGEKNELTEAEMDEIFVAADKIGIEIVPLFNTPFHMEAVITAMGKLNITNAYYGGNAACLNLSNDYATAFVKALMQKYITYFRGKGCKYFNFGADEYVGGWNDTFYNYANDVAKMISEAGMTARAFNDSFRYNSNTYISNEYLKDVCYWYTGYSGNLYSGAKTIADSGYNLINTNKDYYYVLDSSKSSEYKLSSGNYNNGNNSWENYAGGFSNTTYNNWNTAVGNGNYTATPAGSMFCIWCDEPGQGTETEVAQQIRMILRVIGARMQNSDIYSASNELVEGGFKADGTINVPTNNKTVGNDNDTVRVTGPNLAALKCETATVAIQGAAEGKIAAYDVTPSTADNNKYTGEAEVRIKIPEGWDKTKVKAFIVEDGTAKDIDGTATEDGWYVFTAPHFSVMGIYEQAVTYVEKTVTVAVGDSETVTIEGYDYSEQVGEIDTSIATVKVTYEGVTVSEFTPATSISNNAKYIVKYGDKYIDENGKLTDNISEAAEWTYERYNNTYGKLKNSKDQYLTYQSNGSFTTVQGYNNNSWLYVNGTTVNMHDGSGYNIALSLGTKTEGSSQPSTIITFTGVKEGTTSVVIGGTRYTVKVVDATLAQQVLPINLWITNTGVVPDGWGTSYNKVTREGFTYGLDTEHINNGWETFRAIYELKATEDSIHSEQGAKLSELIPNTGKAYGYRGGNTPEEYNVDIWKCSYNASAERQSTDGWTNSSNKGTEFEYIRYWDNKWEYCSAKTGEWTEVGEVGAGKDDSAKNQVCV